MPSGMLDNISACSKVAGWLVDSAVVQVALAWPSAGLPRMPVYVDYDQVGSGFHGERSLSVWKV